MSADLSPMWTVDGQTGSNRITSPFTDDLPTIVLGVLPVKMDSGLHWEHKAPVSFTQRNE